MNRDSNKWLRSIPRANMSVTKNAIICQRHFESRFVIVEDKITVDGKETVIKRHRPKLTDDAYPTIFGNMPSYLSTPVQPPQRTPSARQQEMEQRHEESICRRLESDKVTSFSDVVDTVSGMLSDYMKDWGCKVLSDCMWFYLLHFESIPVWRVVFSCTVI